MGKAPTSAGNSGLGNSPLVRIPQALDPMRKNWVSIAQIGSAMDGLFSALKDLQGQMESLKLVARRLDYMHPFKIYNVPSVLRVTPDDDNDWRLFRVRAGQVMGVDVTGTDADDANPDDESYPDVDDFEVPISTAEYWFWIEDTGSGWVLRYGPDETASSYDGGPDPGQAWTSSNAWTTGPIPDSTHIPVGTVDTDTFSDDNTAVIRQLLRADVVSTAGTSDCPYG